MAILADTFTWQVRYDDDTTLLGIAPESYFRIDRDKLKEFSLLNRSGSIFTTQPPVGATGHNLIYRRRNRISNIDREVIFIIGWVPNGPVHAINPGLRSIRTLDHFDDDDIDLYHPVPMVGECIYV